MNQERVHTIAAWPRLRHRTGHVMLRKNATVTFKRPYQGADAMVERLKGSANEAYLGPNGRDHGSVEQTNKIYVNLVALLQRLV